MGDNTRGAIFEGQVLSLAQHGHLSIEVLDAIAEVHRGKDIDTGGFGGRRNADGRDVYQIVLQMLDIHPPLDLPARDDPEDEFADYWDWTTSAFIDATRARWGWA